MKYIHNIIHISVSLAFLYVAFLQLNDPDPLYWVVVYILVAFVPIRRLLRKSLAKYGIFTLGLIGAGILMSGPGFLAYMVSHDYASLVGNMTMHKPYVEFAREFLGLIIAATGVIYYTFFSKRSGKPD